MPNLSIEAKQRVDVLLYDPDELLDRETDEDLVARIASLESGEELHYFVDEWNWDDGRTALLLRAVLNHPACDLGTASLIYWRGGGPMWPLERDSIDEDYKLAIFDLVVLAETKAVNSAHLPQYIRVDPEDEGLSVSDDPNDGSRPVPPVFLSSTPGEPLEVPD